MAKSKVADEAKTLRDEWPNVLLLIILYMVQGIPLGLSMGSMPFLMRSNMSYTKIGIFTLTGYPYSFKLLWSPIIDSIYNRRIGRRKSWILPLQTCSSLMMILGGPWVEERLLASDAVGVTVMFFVLVLFAATQDIAVDGWALTLLSKHNVGYASTCQTLGMNIGFFASFTVFLALNDADLSNKYFRSADAQSTVGVVTLASYLSMCGWFLLAVTVFVGLFKPEGNSSTQHSSIDHKTQDDVTNFTDSITQHRDGDAAADGIAASNGGARTRRRSTRIAALADRKEDDGPNAAVKTEEQSVKEVSEWRKELVDSYAQLFRVVKLPSVRLLAIVMVVFRIGLLPAESAAALKLLEKGVSKEALAGLVLIEFPVELISAIVAGQWAARNSPLQGWLFGYRLRLALAGCATAVVYYFPPNSSAFHDAPRAFAALAAVGVLTSFAGTLMFTAMGSFYNKISDPAMGGSYLTLLNTLANVGVTVPKIGVFAAIDWFTVKHCLADSTSIVGKVPVSACAPGASEVDKELCTAAGGSCVVLRDGFYVLSYTAVVVGVVVMFWLKRVLPKLDALPQSAWRAGKQRHTS